MKIVIISRHIHPRIDARAMRATELALEMARQGHDVTLYACINGKFDYETYGREHNLKIKDIPARRFFRSESDGTYSSSFFNRAMTRLFGKFLLWPGIELAFKMKKILKAESGADMLITISAPYTIAWGVAYGRRSLGSSFPKVWISDCGDPFMGNAISTPPRYMQRFEDRWGRETDYIAVPIEKAKDGYSREVRDKIVVIPQGFDFQTTTLPEYKPNKVPTFVYAGAIIPGFRDPAKFLEYLCTLDTDFRFYAYVDNKQLFAPFADRLKGKLIVSGYIPRNELIDKMARADFLININNNCTVQLPSKLINYALSKRPILSVSTDFHEQERFRAFLAGDYSAAEKVDIAPYDIRRVTQQFLELTQ